jgi:hypothetical protein
LNPFRQKFPRNLPESGGKSPAREIDVDTATSARNSKMRGGLEVMHIKADDSFNPYERQPEGQRQSGGKRDLRKLSEHIKMMRELEERKKNR